MEMHNFRVSFIILTGRERQLGLGLGSLEKEGEESEVSLGDISKNPVSKTKAQRVVNGEEGDVFKGYHMLCQNDLL